MILLIDNFDSFTYNLQDYLRRHGHDVKTIRYDKMDLESIEWSRVDGIVISPGPYTPSLYPKHFQLYNLIIGKIPILGVCLGFQSIGEFLGAKLVKASKPMHGKVSEIEHNGEAIFQNIENPTCVTRYHSLVLIDLPKCLKPVAFTKLNELMAFYNKKQQIWGVQFHPEAVLTTHGVEMITNWLNYIDHQKSLKTKSIRIGV